MADKSSDSVRREPLGVEDVWRHVRDDLQLSVGTMDFESHVKRLDLIEFGQVDGKQRAKIACPSIFHQKEVERRILAQIKEAFKRVTGSETGVVFAVSVQHKEKKVPTPGPLFSPFTVNRKNELARVMKQAGLKQELNMKSFAVSSSNEMAYAAAKAVSQSPGKAYNPLFLYGGVGVGKTHLMQGVGQVILEKNLEVRLIYCSGEEFTNEIIEAIKQKSTPRFRKRYRNVGLLLIDDIQFIAGKTAVQEEFFHTFNAITKEGGQIVLTSDKPPKEIDRLEERLRSRFEGGLTIDIGEPNFELRSAILMIKAGQIGLELTVEVAQVIAAVETDTRALLGALMQVVALANNRKSNITADLAKEVVAKMSKAREAEKIALKPEGLISGVSSYFNAEVDEVVGQKRHKRVTLPRHVAMYLLKMDFGMGYVEIGKFFGNRDHTTIMHAVRKVTSLAKESGGVGGDVDRLRRELYK